MVERGQLEQAIAHLQAQRAILGDATVDASIAALRQQLATLEAQPQPSKQQRKQVTALFADISGFTAMSETLDAEDVSEVMNALWARLDKTITDHGGRIDKHMGDGVMALWSVEAAREDDPERAIRAALAMQAELAAFREDQQVDLAMRIGINTGPVFLGEAGTTGEYTAIGDAVNLASRMEHAAPVGGILTSHDTYRHVRGVFNVDALEQIQVRGKAEPIQVYVVKSAKPRAFRVATRGVAGIETRMIGRDAELKQLQDAFYAAVEDGERQVVTVIGEAGMGKSRLLYEFDNWAELWPDLFYFFKGRTGEGMLNLPYALIRDLFAFRFQIQDSDRAGAVQEKMEQGIGSALGESETSHMKAHFVGQLLGFDFTNSPHLQGTLDDAKQIRDRAMIYLSDYFKAMAARQPILILLEDLHWADDSSLDVLNHLALTTPNQPLLIVCSARPVLFERRPHWGEGQAFHRCLELRPLSKRDSRRLVEEILQKVEEVPVALRELVVGSTEGNPYYMEEFIKKLIEDGVIIKGEDHWWIEPVRLTTVRVPPALTGILQARLDSLPAEERVILQRAAVIGRIFWGDAVKFMSSGEAKEDVALASLRERELIFQRETSAFAGTKEYIFKHTILREVTYESVLKRERPAYHARAAEWLIAHSGERAGEHTGLIADHLELAGKTEQAITHLHRAGEQAVARFANAEAVKYFSRALELLELVDQEPAQVREQQYALLTGREDIYGLLGQREDQSADLVRLTILADEMDDDRRRAQAALRHTAYHEAISDFPAARIAAQEAARWAERASDPHSKIQGLIRWGIALWRQGTFEEARDRLEEALALARQHDDRLGEASSLHYLGTVLYFLGDYQGARDYLEKALEIRRALGDRRREAMSLSNLVAVYDGLGDLARGKVCSEDALTICQAIGDRQGEAYALGNLAGNHHALGNLAAARDYYVQSLALRQDIGDRGGEAMTRENLGLVLHDLGNYHAALQHCERALAIVRDIGDRRVEGYCLTGLALALEGLGELEAAAAAYEEALCLRREIGQAALAIDDLAGLARIALKQGQVAGALIYTEEALAWIATHDAHGLEYPLRVYLTGADVLTAAGQTKRANEILAAAQALVQERTARISDEITRRGFLENVPLHAQLRERIAQRG